MIHVQRYSGKRVKDGSEVRGYAAVGCESKAVWIMIPHKDDPTKFHSVEVQPDSLVPVL